MGILRKPESNSQIVFDYSLEKTGKLKAIRHATAAASEQLSLLRLLRLMKMR